MGTAATGQIPSSDLASLRAAVEGPVLAPDDPDHAAECTGHNLLRTSRPSVVVGAASADDVAAAVRFAARHRLPVAVRNAGHQMVVPEDGDWLLITLRRMNDVVVDPGRRTVTVGPGARWDDVLPETARHGLAPACGSAPRVGVTGYTLGGGIGPLLSRTHGYAADHVRRMEVVTADGTRREVTPESEPGLFWALLGCKGNFGVVTRMEFGVFPVTRFFGGGLWFSGADAAGSPTRASTRPGSPAVVLRRGRRRGARRVADLAGGARRAHHDVRRRPAAPGPSPAAAPAARRVRPARPGGPPRSGRRGHGPGRPAAGRRARPPRHPRRAAVRAGG
ncbi:FAD-binding oxidoreductase [Streptomyces sp. PsTaAH-124]|uniref:FAD-binding oxidoreductase n=1 Tax=Streptomyces sp. PsTaAH-124 TaxID=1157638 RepID=UPI0003A19176|nr:FAD-binding protein [Streptomyces sp. PsTaAH-124]